MPPFVTIILPEFTNNFERGALKVKCHTTDPLKLGVINKFNLGHILLKSASKFGYFAFYFGIKPEKIATKWIRLFIAIKMAMRRPFSAELIGPEIATDVDEMHGHH